MGIKRENTRFLGNIYGHGAGYAGAVWDKEYLCPTLTTMQGGGREPHIVEVKKMIRIRQATNLGYIECKPGGVADLAYPESKTRRGRVIEQGNVSPTLTCTEPPYRVESEVRIRKLTPRECWRLMGFSDEDFDKAEQVNSNTQLYKQAGNSICVNVLESIFREMIPNNN